MQGALAKKGKHGLWSPRFFALRGGVLEYYGEQPLGAGDDGGGAVPRGCVNVCAVRDVPDRGATTRANRFDVEFACSGSGGGGGGGGGEGGGGAGGGGVSAIELAAERPGDKEAWLAALTAVSHLAPLATHPRLTAMRGAAPRAVEEALQREQAAAGSAADAGTTDDAVIAAEAAAAAAAAAVAE
jgi:hypothetical protein